MTRSTPRRLGSERAPNASSGRQVSVRRGCPAVSGQRPRRTTCSASPPIPDTPSCRRSASDATTKSPCGGSTSSVTANPGLPVDARPYLLYQFAAEVAHQLAHDMHDMVAAGDEATGDAPPDAPSTQFEAALLEELADLESETAG